jgi:tripartite-type tricarboxylate transporter receptor subunit TctC
LLPCFALVKLSGYASAQTAQYPMRPVKVIVPFLPGGATDLVARSVFEGVSKVLGQTFVIENKAGAGGSLGAAEIARAQPDGYTLGIATTSTHAVNPVLSTAVRYDPLGDFTSIGQLVNAPAVLVINASFAPNNLNELISFAQKNPGKINYASAGVGSIGHLWAEMFKSSAKVFMLHVPYRGAGPAQTDLLAGVVQLGFDQVASALPMIKAGKLKALAVGSPTRLASLPTVGTFEEQGLKGFSLSSWFGVVGPAKLPAEIVQKVNGAINTVLANPEFAAKFNAQGLFPAAGTSAKFSQLIGEELIRVRVTVKTAKITIES